MPAAVDVTVAAPVAVPAVRRIGIPLWTRDGALAAVTCLVDVALFSHVLNRAEAPAGSQVPGVVVVAYAAAGFAALAVRRRFPLWVFVALLAHGIVAWQLPLLGYHPTVGLLVGLYTVAVLRGPGSLLALMVSFLPASLVVADAVRLAPADKRGATLVANAVFLFLLGLAVWGVGRWVAASRRQARDLEQRRHAAAREAVAAERRRIARELHDIVAHSVTVMVLQAGGAQQVLRVDADRASEALNRIEELGKQAMAELRRLLVVLRAGQSDDEDGVPDDSRQPGLDDLEDLLRTFRDATLPVRLEVRGEGGPLDRSIDLTAYRIVQEALTNVMKHGGPHAPALVELEWNGSLQIQVTNEEPGRPARSAATLATGHGLLGLRERVSVAGGTLDAGPTPDGGYQVVATLPGPLAGARPAVSR